MNNPRNQTLWTWMPHAGHFICGRDCGFRLNTHVNGYIISTVGELKYRNDRDDAPFREIGYQRLYETMVFPATTSQHACCPYEASTFDEIDFSGYDTAEAAYAGHLAMCEKYHNQAQS